MDPFAPASAQTVGAEDVIDVRRAPWAHQRDGSPALADVEPQPSAPSPRAPPRRRRHATLRRLVVSAAAAGLLAVAAAPAQAVNCDVAAVQMG